MLSFFTLFSILILLTFVPLWCRLHNDLRCHITVTDLPDFNDSFFPHPPCISSFSLPYLHTDMFHFISIWHAASTFSFFLSLFINLRHHLFALSFFLYHFLFPLPPSPSLSHTHTPSLFLIVLSTKTNRTVENIGARRLHTVIERIVEEVSFDAPDKAGEAVIITEEYVKQRLGDLLMKGDMKKYIL